MKKPERIPRPLRKPCRIHSVCGTSALSDLDWDNMFTDMSGTEIYIHVRRVDYDPYEETWHRVYPKGIKGRGCGRISVVDGEPHWLYDKT